MMKQLVFATNNEHKVQEIRAVTGDIFKILTLKEAGILIDIPEPHDTLAANASEKSRTIHQLTALSCFGEDTGLEITALGGAPGVKSARYAGESRDFNANLHKVLDQMQAVEDREARFHTVISLIYEGTEYFFEGLCEGSISRAPLGESGFGYDPIFIPGGQTKSFGEMTLEEKNNFSHRKKAVDKLLDFLSGTV